MKNSRNQALVLYLAAVLMCIHGIDAAGNSWNKIRFLGGTIQVKVERFDWNTTLTVKPDALILVFAARQTVRIKPAQVTSISYGAEAIKRVTEVLSARKSAVPQSLPRPANPSDHCVGIVYQAEDGTPGAILLEPLKAICLDILQALKFVTGKPIEMS